VTKTWRYVLGGAVIGGVVGAILGAGLAKKQAERQQLVAAGALPARQPMDMNKTIRIGISVFDLIRQIVELGR